MKSWKIWTALLAVFILGATTGIFGTGLYLKHRFHPDGNPDQFHEKMRRRITDRILETVQPIEKNRAAVEEAILATLDEADQLRLEVDPKIKAILTRGEKRVKSLLTPEARQRFEKMIKEFKRRQGDRPFPPPPPPLF